MSKEELAKEIRDILGSGIGRGEKFQETIDKHLARWRTKIRRRKIMPTPELDALIEEVKEEYSQDSEANRMDSFLREFNSKIKDNFNYSGKSLTLDIFRDEDFNPNQVTLKTNKIKKWETIQNELQVFRSTYHDIFVQGDFNKMDNMLEHIHDWIIRGADLREVREVDLAPQQLIRGVLNIRLTENRKKMYRYWEKISKEHSDVLGAITEFKVAVQQSGLSEEIKSQVEKLPVNVPNYIVEVPAKKQNILKLGKRMGDWIGFLIHAYSESRGISSPTPRTGRRPHGYSDLTTPSKMRRGATTTTQKPFTKPQDPQEPDYSVKERALVPTGEKPQAEFKETMRQPIHDLTEQELDEELKDFEYVDPIYYNILLDTKNNFPIRSFELEEAEERLNKWINKVRNEGLEPLEKELQKKLQQLQKEAVGQDGEDKYHIPMTSWVDANYSSKMIIPIKPKTQVPQQISPFKPSGKSSMPSGSDLGTVSASNIEEKTSEFFDILADILFEFKGQEKVIMSPEYPEAGVDVGQERTPLISGPAMSGSWGDKPTKEGLKVPRQQAGIEPRIRTDWGDDVDAKLKNLLKKLDSYYFIPIFGKEYLFIDEVLPTFSSQLEGSRSFNITAITFSEHPPLQQQKDISATLEDNLEYLALADIRNFLKNEISEESKHNVEQYKKTLTDIIKAFVDWGLDEKWAAEFAADQFARYLTARQMIDQLDEHDIGEYNAGHMYGKWKERGGWSGSIIYSIRSFLKSTRYKTILREWEVMGMKKVVEQFNTLTKEILELTSPEVVNNIPDIAKALLTAHDVVRKMQDKEVVYAKLSISDLDAMDYIITKMDNKYRIDITANDIIGIVHSNDSFKSLSYNYGLSENIIYEIKGLCR